MMTQTHLLVATAAYAKPSEYSRNAVIILGALVPDLALYTLFFYYRMGGTAPETIFDQLYWSEAWQIWMRPGNSFPLFMGLGLLGIFLAKSGGRKSTIGTLLALFSTAALLHLILDFPLHSEDAHSHFWPITHWKFNSPVSYWDDRHYGAFIRPIEYALAVLCLAVLLWRFRGRLTRLVLGMSLLLYVVVPLYFVFIHPM